jgi:hypothetical protein
MYVFKKENITRSTRDIKYEDKNVKITYNLEKRKWLKVTVGDINLDKYQGYKSFGIDDGYEWNIYFRYSLAYYDRRSVEKVDEDLFSVFNSYCKDEDIRKLVEAFRGELSQIEIYREVGLNRNIQRSRLRDD